MSIRNNDAITDKKIQMGEPARLDAVWCSLLINDMQPLWERLQVRVS